MEWKKLVDKALGTNFDAPVYDPQKGRDKLVRQIDLAAKQHSEGTTRAPNRAWRAGNNEAIRFAAKLDGKPVLLDGDEAVYVPVSRFQDFLKHLKASVQAGDLDKDIKVALEAPAESGSTTINAPRTRAPNGTGKAPKTLEEQIVYLTERAGPPLSEGMVPNSKATKWISPENRARGEAAAASRAAGKSA